MDIQTFENLHNVKLVKKTDSRLMRLVGKVLGPSFTSFFYTTVRLPWQKRARIYTPTFDDIFKYGQIPTHALEILQHELVHKKQQATQLGLLKSAFLYFFFPLPIFFSGRWFLEREAYLLNILNHGYTVEEVVNALWSAYLFAWPKPLMRAWFNKKIKD